MNPPESIYLYWLIVAIVGGVSFIVGGYIGEGRGRRQARREFERRWSSHSEQIRQRWIEHAERQSLNQRS